MQRSALLAWLGVVVLVATWVGGWQGKSGPAFGGAASLTRFEYRRVVMGAPCALLMYAPSESVADGAAAAAFARLAEIEEALSDYLPSSETRQLPTRAGVRVPIGNDLAKVLQRSREHCEASEGAFDPTIAPVIALWREARRSGTVPKQHEIHRAMMHVGMRQVTLGCNPDSYMTQIDGIRLDFGGIGQGYGADEALQALQLHGVRRALVDLSGDLAAGDAPPGATGWRVSVPCLDSTMLLAAAALAVSGDESQHLASQAPDGTVTRYSHLVDARSGMALTTRTSVVVIAPNAMDADALATSLSVLGPTRSSRALERFAGARAVWVTSDELGVATVTPSAGWPVNDPNTRPLADHHR